MVDKNRIERWVQTGSICVMLGFVAFTTHRCTDALGSNIGIIQYDGFENNCELQGGIVHDGRCFDTTALIPVEVITE